jgi:hypothetical protein
LLRRALRQKRTYRMWRAATVWLADLLTIWRRQLWSGGGGHEPVQSFATVKIDPVAPVSGGAARHSAEPDAVAAALPAVRSRGRIEVDVAGARIRIESGVDHATLAMVLAAVRGDG